MKTVEQLIAQYQSLSPEEKMLAFNQYTMTAINSCIQYEDDYEAATLALGTLTYAAIIADDRISDEELLLLYTGMKVTLGEQADLEKCKQLAQETLKCKDDIKEAARLFAEDYLALWEDDDKEDVILLCIALCAMDGVISDKEIRWLKELVAAAQ